MAAFMQSIGLGGLKINNEGYVTLEFDKTMAVTFVCQGSDSIAAVCKVGNIGNKEDDYLKNLLKLNFTPTDHGGGRYALEPESDKLVMVNVWNVTKMSVEEFSKFLEDFLNSIEKGQAMFI